MSADALQLHTCTVCQRVAPWDDGWQWCGTVLQLDHAPDTIDKTCSEACRARHKPSARCRAGARKARDETNRFRRTVREEDGTPWGYR